MNGETLLAVIRKGAALLLLNRRNLDTLLVPGLAGT